MTLRSKALDFTPSFCGCPTGLVQPLHEGIQQTHDEALQSQIQGGVRLFILGMNFYGLSRWMCSDYIHLYGFAGDCFKAAADTFARVGPAPTLAMFSYARAGHCYRASNELERSSFSFFQAFSISLDLSRTQMAQYAFSEGCKSEMDRWLMFATHDPESEKPETLDEFLLRLDAKEEGWLAWFALSQTGFKVDVTTVSQDGAVELQGTYTPRPWKNPRRLLVQLRNPRKAGERIGAGVIRAVGGLFLSTEPRPDEVIVVTTTDFTGAAMNEAKTASFPLKSGQQEPTHRDAPRRLLTGGVLRRPSGNRQGGETLARGARFSL